MTPEPVSGHGQALSWFRAEHQVLLAAISLAAETGFDRHAWQLAWAVCDFLDLDLQHPDAAQLRTRLQTAKPGPAQG